MPTKYNKTKEEVESILEKMNRIIKLSFDNLGSSKEYEKQLIQEMEAFLKWSGYNKYAMVGTLPYGEVQFFMRSEEDIKDILDCEDLLKVTR